METLLEGAHRAAAGAAADPHPPRPRGRGRGAGGAVSRPRGLGACARRAAPDRPEQAARQRRAPLRRPDGPAVGAGACRCPERNIRVLEGGERLSVAGRELDVEYTPGHASHHVVYFDDSDGTAYVGDVAGVRIPPSDFVRPPTPPPDIDVEAWAALDRPGRRARARAAGADPLRRGRGPGPASRADEAAAATSRRSWCGGCSTSTATPEAVRAFVEEVHAPRRASAPTRGTAAQARRGRADRAELDGAAPLLGEAAQRRRRLMATETIERPRDRRPRTGQGAAGA